MRRVLAVLKNFFLLFFGKDEQVDLRKEGRNAVAAAVVYRSSQYGAMLAAESVVAAMQKIGWGDYFIVFSLLFVANTAMTGGVIMLNRRSEVDFSFMRGGRNITREAFEISIIFGFLIEFFSFFVLLIWSGADQFIIFFDEKFSSKTSKICTFILASACSMAIWTHIYIGVATGFWDLVEKLYGK